MTKNTQIQTVVQQEPVAWMKISKCGQGVFDLYNFSANQYDGFDTPVYRHPPSVDVERLSILKAIGDAGLILIKGHTGFELIKKESVIAQLVPDNYQVV